MMCLIMDIINHTHTITSPNTTMNTAPPTLAVKTNAVSNISAVNTKIVIRIIIIHLHIRSCNMCEKKDKSPCLELKSLKLVIYYLLFLSINNANIPATINITPIVII